MSWYLRYSLRYRDIEELLLERGLVVDHSTVDRWVTTYALLIEGQLRPFRQPHCGSVRVDETYVQIWGESHTTSRPRSAGFSGCRVMGVYDS